VTPQFEQRGWLGDRTDEKLSSSSMGTCQKDDYLETEDTYLSAGHRLDLKDVRRRYWD
jgi:hypothetical protein